MTTQLSLRHTLDVVGWRCVKCHPHGGVEYAVLIVLPEHDLSPGSEDVPCWSVWGNPQRPPRCPNCGEFMGVEAKP